MKKSSPNPSVVQRAVQAASGGSLVTAETVAASNHQPRSLNLVTEADLPAGVRDGGAAAEFEKDVWFVHNIVGARVSLHRGTHSMNFSTTPAAFRPGIKRYMKLMVVTHAWMSCCNHLRSMRRFAQFYAQRHPEANDLRDMTREDVESYVIHLQTHGTANRTDVASARFRYHALMAAETWVRYLQAADDPAAPATLVERLFWREDRGPHWKNYVKKPRKPKYIPDFVVKQVDEHLHELRPAAYVPVALLLRATCWRVSDVLNLRHDTCLEKTDSGWWLCGDVPKTGLTGHRAPLTEEIARVVEAQRTFVQKFLTQEQNPRRLLFPALSKERGEYGLAMTGDKLGKALRRLIQDHDIRDEEGNFYDFTPHAFRHTKAVEWINNDMPLLYVQKLMAHVSPEMTLVYAEILDTTMREKFEEAMAKGALRIQDDGKATMVDVLGDGDEGQIEWEHVRHNLDAVRLPDGYCFKPKKVPCPIQAIKCHNCKSFRTTPDFLPQFQAHRQDLLIQIERGKSMNRQQWVERNEQLLGPIESIIQTLETGKTHQAAEGEAKGGKDDQ